MKILKKDLIIEKNERTKSLKDGSGQTLSTPSSFIEFSVK